MRRLLTLIALWFAVAPALTFAQIGDEVLPPVFVETLLELPDDAAQAAKSRKRLLLLRSLRKLEDVSGSDDD